MSRLIDADALWMDIIHAMDYCDDILEIIEQQPTVEQKTGKWVNNINDMPICNQCGYMTPYDRAIDDYEYGNYCPMCGAKMEVQE